MAHPGTMTTLPDPDGAGLLQAPVLNYVYDAAGQLVQETDASGGVTQYATDASRSQNCYTHVNLLLLWGLYGTRLCASTDRVSTATESR